MSVDDSQVLSYLLSRYENCVLYETGWPNELRLAKAFSSLEHTHGGIMLLGVSPTGHILGVPEREREQSRQRIYHLVGKLYSCVSEIGFVEIKGKTVIFLIFNAVPDHVAPINDLCDRVQNREEITLSA